MGEPGRGARALVLGVGSDDRADDGVGLDVVRALRERPPIGADLLETSGDLTRVLELWRDRAGAVVVDATLSGAAPGTVRLFEADAPLPRLGGGAVSSHGVGLAEVLELGRRLGRLPPRLAIVGIEAASFTLGRPRTPAVRAAVPEACRRVGELIERWRAAPFAAERIDA